MARSSAFKNSVLLILALLFACIAVEVFLRLFHPVEYRKPPARLSANAWLEMLHRPSRTPGLAYELTPNKVKLFNGRIIRINSEGMRDKEPRRSNSDTLHRILVLGDSYTFGFGVDASDTYSAKLERLLNKGFSDNPYEVLNLGVGGYSTRDEAVVLEHKGSKWNPDLIIIGYVLNDPEIEPRQPLHSYYHKPQWWQYFSFFRLIAEAKNNWDVKVDGKGDYYRYLHYADGKKWKSVIEAFDKISRLAHRQNTPVLVVIFPRTSARPWDLYPYTDIHRQVGNAATRFGLFVVDLLDVYRRYPSETLMVRPGDPHPSKLGHRISADAIYRWISRNRGSLPLFADKMQDPDQATP